MTQPTSVRAKEHATGVGVDHVAPPQSATHADRPAWRPESGWRDVLAGRQPDEILARLLDGDPLRLRWLVAGEIRGGAYFLNADRVQLRALARIAHDVPIDGPPADGAWVHEHVRGALADVLREERRAISGRQHAAPDHDPPLDVLDALAGPLGFDGLDLRIACDAFNRMESKDRHAFFALFIERRSLDDAAKACLLSPADLGKRARVALLATMEAVKQAALRKATAAAAQVKPVSPQPAKQVRP